VAVFDYWIYILKRSIVSSPDLLGQTWIGICFSLTIFVAIQIPAIMSQGGLTKGMKHHWQQNLAGGAKVVLTAWSLLVLINLFDTIYKDRSALAAENQIFKNAKEQYEKRPRLSGHIEALDVGTMRENGIETTVTHSG
jgi:hypothetical protein